MKRYKNILAILLIFGVTFIGVVANGSKSFSGYGESSLISLLVSILFVLVWSVCSFYYGIYNNRTYLVFMTIYFFLMVIIAGISFLFSNSNDTLIIFLIPAFTVVIPLYGFVEILPLSEQIAAILCIFSVIVINYLAFFIGDHRINNTKH